MAKKIFARSRVVKGARWHIDFTVYDTETGTETRHRKHFGLNDIQNIEVRTEVARILSTYIEDFASLAPVASEAKAEKPVSLRQAVEFALSQKLLLPRKNSHRSYRSVSKRFLTWCNAENLADMPLKKFTRRHARRYWDFFTGRRQYRAATLQNHLIALGGLWSEMRDDELTDEKPWTNIKPPRSEEKQRRPFTDVERMVVAQEAEKTDYWLFRAIILQFYCYIRPVEITRLRFRDFDLGRGLVVVQSGNAKKWKRRTATIPESMLHYFRDGRFDKYPGNYLVLSKVDLGNKNYRVEPGTVPIDDDRMYRRHKKLLDRLVDTGKLTNTEGLTWYSWKDTGISLHTRKTSPVATKDQAGHTNLSITSLYYHAEEVNTDYQKLANDLTE